MSSHYAAVHESAAGTLRPSRRDAMSDLLQNRTTTSHPFLTPIRPLPTAGNGSAQSPHHHLNGASSPFQNSHRCSSRCVAVPMTNGSRSPV